MALITLVAQAQVNQPKGQHRAKVIETLKAVAGGSCPENLMSPLLLDQCEQQLPRMQEALRRLGTIKDAQFRGVEPLQGGIEAEVYRVIFENGQMTWLAATGPNGKLNVLYAPPQ